MQNCCMSLHTSPSPTVKILVVDDYPNAADLLARSLSRLDSRLEVVAAISAYQALEYVKKGAAKILITDMDMPEMTGLELIERLQEYSQGTSIVSFLITASHTQELKIKARELNVREVFHKPVHPERICEVISRVLEEIHEAFQ
jgi:CheY-like chemotaxis protein